MEENGLTTWHGKMTWDEKLHHAENCIRTVLLALEALDSTDIIESTLIIAADMLSEVNEELTEKKEPQPAGEQN